MSKKGCSSYLMRIVTVIFVIGLISFAGCQSPTASESFGDFKANGLPKQQYLVGGGIGINWVAPSDGTVYLTEENISPGRILITATLKSGESFNQVVEPEDAQILYGVNNLSELKFSLYFIPRY